MTSLTEPTDAFLDDLRAALGPQAAREPEPRHLEEPRGRFVGRAALLAAPSDVEGVATVMRACQAAGVGLVPVSGATGLVAGHVATDGPRPVLLSLERMARIRDVSVEDDVLIAEAGVVLADVQAAAEAADRLFPLSLASEGSARIGGLLATNAGGVAVLRYGMARDLCLGVEAVLPDGSIHHGLKRLRKDNTGFDLRNLLIGSEGALGVVTAAALKLFPRPKEIATALVAVDDPAAAVGLLRRLQSRLGETLSAVELMSDVGMGFVLETIDGVSNPFAERHPWTVLVEAGGVGVRDGLEEALADAAEAGGLRDAVLASNGAQRAALWRLREETPAANKRIGAIASHDVSVPVSRIDRFVREAGAALARAAPEVRINAFGHVGDGNLHYNLFPPQGGSAADHRGRAAELTRIVHDVVAAHDGSFAAEHGVGRLKTDDLARYGDPALLAAMAAIKAALDPKGICNPGVKTPNRRTGATD